MQIRPVPEAQLHGVPFGFPCWTHRLDRAELEQLLGEGGVLGDLLLSYPLAVRRLLLFDRVRIESLDSALDPERVARCTPLLGDGGRLELVERLPLRGTAPDPWGLLVSDLDRAEDRLERLVDRLPGPVRAMAVAEGAALPDPEGNALLVLDGGSLLGRWARAEEALRAGWAVLRVGEAPLDRIHLLLRDGTPPAQLARLARLLPREAQPTVLLPPSAQADPPFAQLLGVESASVRATSERLGAREPDLDEVLGEQPGLVLLFVDPSVTALALGLSALRSGASVVLLPSEDQPDAEWHTSLLVDGLGGLGFALEQRTPLGSAPLEEAVVPVVDGTAGPPLHAVRGQVVLDEAPAGPLWIAAASAPRRIRAVVELLPRSGEPLELLEAGRSGGEHGRRVLLRLDATPLHRLAAEAERGGCVGVIDAGAVLQDGAPPDLPLAARRVRARRVVRRLMAAGHRVAGFWLGGRWEAAPEPADPRTLLVGAAAQKASSLGVDWDNGSARRRLIARIDAASGSVELQTYQVQDDATVREVELALARAAARGVAVRVLADAVWSARGTVDSLSPVLARLNSARGLAVRLVRPFAGLPSVVDLKRRDHRKVLVVDGGTAILGGRNLGEPYLRGFDEVPLGPASLYREVPWLDASVEVQGPVVAGLRAAFEQAWAEGTPVDLEEPLEVPATPTPPEGELDVRLVLHEGLEDAFSLEVIRELIDGAEQQISVVNTFPLQFELLEALLRALRRGVSVRVLVGNVRPLHGDRVPFPGGGVRDLANEVVHGRLDVLVDAGAAVHEFVLPLRPGWDPALGRVLPHVHAKVLSADGRRFTIGSANLDITAAYWESEVVLLVEDAGVAAELEQRLDELFGQSQRVDRDDPRWQRRAGRRRWLSRNWPAALG